MGHDAQYEQVLDRVIVLRKVSCWPSPSAECQTNSKEEGSSPALLGLPCDIIGSKQAKCKGQSSPGGDWNSRSHQRHNHASKNNQDRKADPLVVPRIKFTRGFGALVRATFLFFLLVFLLGRARFKFFPAFSIFIAQHSGLCQAPTEQRWQVLVELRGICRQECL